MLCDHCQERDAVVHLTQIVDNAVTQLHLCEKCAAAKGIETTIAVPKHPLGDFLHDVEITAVLEHAHVRKFQFGSGAAEALVFLADLGVGILRVGIFVERLHVGMRWR